MVSLVNLRAVKLWFGLMILVSAGTLRHTTNAGQLVLVVFKAKLGSSSPSSALSS